MDTVIINIIIITKMSFCLSVALFFSIAPLKMAVSVLSVCAAATSCIHYC